MLNSLTEAFEAITSTDPNARREAALLLGQHPTKTTCEILVNALGDPNIGVQDAIAQSLLLHADVPEQLELLVAAHKDNNPVRRNAALAVLIEITHQSTLRVMDALRHSSPEVREWAAEALGDVTGQEQVVPALITRLEDASEFPNVRRAAAQALGKLGNSSASPALLKAAAHGDFWMRQAAIEAVSRLGDEKVVPALLELMRQDAWTRPAVIKALGQIGHVDAVPALVTALEDQSDSTRAASLEALFKIVMEPTGRRTGTLRTALLRPVIPLEPLRRELKQDRLPGSAYAAHLLGWLGRTESVPELIEALNSAEAPLRDAATESLLRFGQNAVPSLLTAVTRPETNLRERVIEILGLIGDRSVVPALMDRLTDPELNVRLATLRALGALGGEMAYSGLLQAVNDAATRDTALSILSQSNSDAAIQDLKSYLQRYLYESKSQSQMRWAAAQALSLLGDETAVSILLNATRLPDEGIRKPAAEALARVRGRRAVNVLIEALGDRDWLVRQKAVEALSSIQDTRVVAALLPLTRDSEWRVRWALANALGKLRDSRIYGPLQKLAQDSDRWVRHRVMEVCARLEDVRAEELAINGLKDPEPAVRVAALLTLRAHRDFALAAPVADLAHDPVPEVRRTAARTLALVAGPASIDTLAILAHDPVEEVRLSICQVLGELGLDEGVTALETLLRDHSLEVRRQAGAALAHIGTTASIEALVEALTHPTVKPEAQALVLSLGDAGVRVLLSTARSTNAELRLAAAETLGKTRSQHAAPALQHLRRDPDARVRQAADQALKALEAK